MDSDLKKYKDISSHSSMSSLQLSPQTSAKPKMNYRLISKSKGLVVLPKEINNELYQILKARLNSHTQILVKELSFTFVLPKPKQTFKPVINLLKNEKCLMSFKSSFPLQDSSQLAQAISTLKSSLYITSLALQIDSHDLSNESFKSFSLKLRTLKNISDLGLHFLESQKISSKGFQILFSSLSCLRSLSNLSLGFPFSDQINDLDLRFISLKLKLLGLQSLTLNFAQCEHITDKGLQSLSEGLSSLKNLKVLEMDFSYMYKQITNEGVLGIFVGLGQVSSLNSLSLSLDYSELTKISDREPLSIGLMQLIPAKIKKLSLRCYKYFSDIDASKFLDSLKHFDGLVNLNLGVDCSYYQFFGHGFKGHWKSLQCFSLLSSLTLNFSTCVKLDNEILETLAEGISQCKNLTQLSLNFSRCKNITDGGVENLSKSLEVLRGLLQVCLDFGSCEKITDNGVRVLCERLKEMENLGYLQLIFLRCKSVTNHAVQEIGGMIKRLRKLEYLHLTMAYCRQVNDEAIQTLAVNLKHLMSLTSLILNFRQCEVSGERSMRSFFGMLENMKGLKSLILHFPSFSGELEVKMRLLQILRFTKIYITFHET